LNCRAGPPSSQPQGSFSAAAPATGSFKTAAGYSAANWVNNPNPLPRYKPAEFSRLWVPGKRDESSEPGPESSLPRGVFSGWRSEEGWWGDSPADLGQDISVYAPASYQPGPAPESFKFGEFPPYQPQTHPEFSYPPFHPAGGGFGHRTFGSVGEMAFNSARSVAGLQPPPPPPPRPSNTGNARLGKGRSQGSTPPGNRGGQRPHPRFSFGSGAGDQQAVPMRESKYTQND
jgi:hypothetical protein